VSTALISIEMARLRRSAGLTQAELARRMGVSQPVVARAETDWSRQLTIDFIDRYARACGSRLTLRLGDEEVDEGTRRQRVRAVLPGYRPNPYDRSPSLSEIRSLERDGLTREHFASTSPA
jgi:transcriptional regulator with XRE-family HTH domain